MEDWHAAFGKNLLVLRAEDAIDRPVPTRQRVWRFLGVRPPTADAATSSLPASSYASLHAKGVPMPMRNDTRARLAASSRPASIGPDSFGPPRDSPQKLRARKPLDLQTS